MNRLNKKGLLDPAYRLNDREHATVLAALRHWQRSLDNNSVDLMFDDIATNDIGPDDLKAALGL